MASFFSIRKLKLDMAARGWRAKELARAAGVSQKTVSLVLSGARQNPATVQRLAQAMGYTAKRYVVAR